MNEMLFALLIIVNSQVAVTGALFTSEADCRGIVEYFNKKDDAPGTFFCGPVLSDLEVYSVED